jgi:hypothetical protein
MKRYWVSWTQRTEDFRPLSYPPNESILGWWCSGSDGDGNAVLCAVVAAAEDSDVCSAIFKDWPEAKDEIMNNNWRIFCEKKVDWKPGDRFPINKTWMAERFVTGNM